MTGLDAIENRNLYMRWTHALLLRLLLGSFGFNVFQAITIIVLVVMLGLTRDRFVMVGPDLRIQQIPTLEQPYLSDDQIRTWAGNAISACLTFSFADQRAALEKNCRPFFTDDGFASFLDALDAAKFRDTVRADYQVVQSQPSATALISAKTPRDKATPGIIYSWVVQLPIISTHYKGSGQITRRHVVELVLVRVPNLTNYGVAINQIIMTPTTGTSP